ncbi:sigma-B regulation protein RsbU (phosphoserine phosphatase) [Selenomonas ruminantium]|nr:HAMP domain-containing protein [Selenomonas ruminantium]SHK73386.1 sigma-B regulation protein RsbU (phosphoserine phosphatase) [Selenomonas ruminantium]
MTCAAPYYDGNGFAGVVGISYTVEDIYQELIATAMAYKGKCFVLDEGGKLIFSSEKEGILAVTAQGQDIRQAEGSHLADAVDSMTAGENGVMSVDIGGQDYYLVFAPLKVTGWSLGILLDTDEILDPVEKVEDDVIAKLDSFEETLRAIQKDILWQSIFILLPVLFLLMYASNLLAGRFTRPVRRLAEGAREIAAGDFEKKFALETGDELEDLADSFNFMTDELKQYTENMAKAAAEEERSRTELEVAAKIQTDMLPKNFAGQPEFELYALMEPAKDVGGDFYDFYLLKGRYLVITVADVSGKGVPAALFMAKSQAVLKIQRALAAAYVGPVFAALRRSLPQKKHSPVRP